MIVVMLRALVATYSVCPRGEQGAYKLHTYDPSLLPTFRYDH